MESWKSTFLKQGITEVSWTKLDQLNTLENYKHWIENEFHGEMEYLKTHIPKKEAPEKLLPGVKSAFVAAIDYVPHPRPKTIHGKIAKYALGEDYHHWIESKLQKITDELAGAFPNEHFYLATDSKPILERELGYKAGLGWVGKNTCLINQKRGSFFFIAEILSTREAPEKIEVAPDRCGTCTRCIDACPTGAIVEERVLDATKCISYWTIESKNDAPEALRDKFEGWYFGCDICQDVCPWNRKVISTNNNSIGKSDQVTFLKEVLKMSNTEIKKNFKGTALSRATPNAHRRNAIVSIANQGFHELLPEISEASKRESLKDVALWAIEKLKS